MQPEFNNYIDVVFAIDNDSYFISSTYTLFSPIYKIYTPRVVDITILDASIG